MLGTYENKQGFNRVIGSDSISYSGLHGFQLLFKVPLGDKSSSESGQLTAPEYLAHSTWPYFSNSVSQSKISPHLLCLASGLI